MNVRYAISLNSYQKYIATTIAEDVSEETMAAVSGKSGHPAGGEHRGDVSAPLYGQQIFLRISHRLYRGRFLTEEYNSLSEEDKDNYDQTDTIGKSGLEQTLVSTLKGKKGEVKLYVNNVGKVDRDGAGDGTGSGK